jgi:hypothetical protein
VAALLCFVCVSFLAQDPLERALAFLAVPENEALNVVTFAEPVRVQNLLAGKFGQIGDVVAGDRGTLCLATRNGERVLGAMTHRAR